MEMDYTIHVQEYTRSGKTRFVVATYYEDDGQYVAPMNKAARQATGCYASFARRLEDIDMGNSYTYARRSDALRRAVNLANPS